MKTVQYCTRCVMPSTRPGISFNADGLCSACQYEDKKKTIDWDQRYRELKDLCDRHRTKKGYNCIITSSGGKDSTWANYVFKELMGMNTLLLTVSDNFPQTYAGKHNFENISERFGCDTIVMRPNIRAEKTAVRYAFEKYLKPTFIVDRYIYTWPLWMAKQLDIPLIVYGENVSCEYGGVDSEETPSAINQVNNGVASAIPKQEFIDAGIPEDELFYFDPPQDLSGIEPVYLSYFMKWNSHQNYIFSKNNGFLDLQGEWDRSHHAEHYDQIDSPAYLVHAWAKYPKFGHAQATDYCSKYVRYGLMTREEAIKMVMQRDGKLDNRCVKEFCEWAGYTITEFWNIVNRFYNPDLFEKDEFGDWKLRYPLK